MSQPLAPRGGNDRIYTPPELAERIVKHFHPRGMLLEPCAGKHAFTNAMWPYSRFPVDCCEIDVGSDFLSDNFSGNYDWIITNPPWSKFRDFLKKSMEVSENIVFLSLLNAWFMKARVRDMREAGFGMVEILMLDTPPKPWPQTGFQLSAVHIKRDYRGPVTITHL
jgi:hypothetical protein